MRSALQKNKDLSEIGGKVSHLGMLLIHSSDITTIGRIRYKKLLNVTASRKQGKTAYKL
ncbi:hypothetical protein AG1IA_08992 [Rhizoctonia solani AG-1 IA]|uniref:Uncharacterized protein n=1 Tax=Thanatephorus cucumeris (strain AG1-IA) TaxID=983506 RepID=L8WJR6_THACA|nr:hypothetical protein AG1IA_08992 [Rhizoctonia solani AG-1 IA]